MEPARKFLRLSARDQLFLLKSAALVGLIRLGLWLLPFQTVRRLLDNISSPTIDPQPPQRLAINRISWAVDVTSRYIPKASCLTQALATQVLLSRRGYPATLQIGVAKDNAGRLEAHAWVESEDQIIVGGADSPSRFTPFPAPEGENR